MNFYKYHTLGNDYIILPPDEFGELTKDRICRLCYRNLGIGSDGILYGPTNKEGTDFALRIFNTGGSEVKKIAEGVISEEIFD